MMLAKDLEAVPLNQLRLLLNTGMMPQPMTKNGYYDLESSERIRRWVRQGYKD